LRSLKKDNTGYDLKSLFLGAEGTLGIITKAVLKLFPKPKDLATAFIAVPSPKVAVEILSAAREASEDNVTSFEFMGRLGLEFTLRHTPGIVDPLSERHEWYVLMEWSSPRAPEENGSGLKDKMEAFLGDMLELGPTEKALHAGLAALPEIAGVDAFYLAGPCMKALYDALPSEKRGDWYEDSDKLAQRARRVIDAGDVCMVKGSLGMVMRRVVDEIKRLGTAGDPQAQEEG